VPPECPEECEAIRKDGGRVWVAPGGKKICDAAGRVVRVHCVLHDLTARRHAETELRAHSQQLEAIRGISVEITRELNLRTVLHLIGRRLSERVGYGTGGVCLWDEAAQMLIPHTKLEEPERERFGLRLGQGVAGKVAERREGLTINDYPHWTGASPEVLARSKITAVMAEPLLYHDRLVGVIHMDTEDPRVAFTDQDRGLLRLFASPAAIAIENAHLFEAQQRAFAEAQRAQDESVRTEKLRALGQMSAGIAHDLNNKLAVILGQAELLKLQAPPARVREGLGILEAAATEAAEVVRRLRDFARQGETGTTVPVDLAGVVQEAVELTRPRWEDEVQRRGVEIRVRMRLDDLPPVLGHGADIREALADLIFNAVDAMPEGGLLSLTGRRDADRIALTVADTGLGMPEEVRERAFEPFFTTKGVKGSGLGLSAAYGIMNRLGGDITIASALGHGTSVTLRFRPAPGGAARPGESPPPGLPRRILLVDDEPFVRRTLADLLGMAGHAVTEADGGLAALARLAESPVDCVLTDLGMPGMNGWELARAIKSRAPELPVILLTGWADQGEADAPPGLVERILSKPVRAGEILRAVAEAVGKGSAGPVGGAPGIVSRP
jgi:signal transduction histidine kinase/ActR/RegA family two-component response regulator